MGKLVLLSILVATVAVPAAAARHLNARRGLGVAVISLLAFAVLYWLGVQYLTPEV